MSNENPSSSPTFPPLESTSDAFQRALWWREMVGMLRQVENDFRTRIDTLEADLPTPPPPPIPAHGGSPLGILEPNTLWLAPSEPGTHAGGSGTFSDPVRITSAEDFDAAITRTEIKHLRLHAGVYLTRGNWAWPRQCILPNGGSLIGAGVGRTIIRLAESAAFTGTGGTHLDVNVLWLGVPDENNGGWTVSDLTIDGNHSQVIKNSRQSVRSGLRIHGNAAHIARVEVVGLRGRYEVDPITKINYEAFGISTINAPAGPWKGPDGGTVIEDCVVRDCCPKSYCSAISVGYRIFHRPVIPSIVQRCRVPQFTENWFAYAACDATTFRDCYASGCYFAFFNDTDGVDGWLIDGCETYTSRAGVSISAVEGAAGHGRKCHVRVINSTFGWIHETGQDKFVALLWDRKKDVADLAEWNDFEVSNCRILEPPAPPPNVAPNKLYLANVLALRAKHFRFENNIVPKEHLIVIHDETPLDSILIRGTQNPGGTPDLRYIYEDPKTIWLAPIDPASVTTRQSASEPVKRHKLLGRGTASDPYRVASAAQFDGLLQRFRTPTRFLLHPGAYQTVGSHAFADGRSLSPGSELIGIAGSASTRLSLASSASTAAGAPIDPAPLEVLTGGSPAGTPPGAPIQFVRVEGLTIDLTDLQGRASVALRLWAHRAIVIDVAVIGVWGKWDAAAAAKTALAEGGGIWIHDAPNAIRGGGHRIDRCSVEMKRGACATGIRVGSLTGNTERTLVTGCRIVGNGGTAQDYSLAAYAANRSVTLRDCICESVAFAFNGSSGPVESILIDGCSWAAAQAIVAFVTADARPRQRVRLVNSEFAVRGGQHPESALLHLEDPTGNAEIADLTIESCHIRASLDATVARFLLASMNSPRATRLRVSGCTYPAFAETRQAVALMNNAASNPLVLTNNTTIA
ncbi:MAG: hypothetical protein JNK85_13390 [Verrucomicrobiales bacterium]|nr:hypothetical protein [Verrucomicrobiales bacterium]